MKKAILFTLFISLFAADFLFAQDNSQSRQNATSEPPNRVKANFKARYPDISDNAQWQKKGQGYSATFRQNGKPVVCDFDENGKWLKSSTELQENQLPKDAQQYIKENYPQYKYNKGVRHENGKGSRYEVDLQSQNENYRLNFDKEGGFVDEKKSREIK